MCGGRDYRDWTRICTILNKVARKHTITCLIHGGQRGADKLAGEWAKDNGIPVEVFEADWNSFGRAAGPKRNQKMIDEGRPDAAVAFPGGDGTADMVGRVKAAGIKPWEILP